MSLAKMKHWEMAPFNPAVFEKNNIDFAISLTGLEDKKSFWPNLRKAIACGLSERQALKSLTYMPAKLIGQDALVGSLTPGKVANFLVTSGNIFDEENVIYENWIHGNKHIINPMELKDVRGTHALKLETDSLMLLIRGKPGKYNASIVLGEKDTVKVQLKVKGSIISLSFKSNADQSGVIRLNGSIENDQWLGTGEMPDGEWISWSSKLIQPIERKNSGTTRKEGSQPEQPGALLYPNMAYGWEKMPSAKTILIKNATVWTNEKEGIVNDLDVLVQNGKISAIGKITAAPSDATVMDATGLHLTPGIIDEHSHIAITGGVNESGQAVSAEVSIADVINSDNIHIYRQLAGGVTSAQLLHGSANPIGGQSGLIKFRWGSTPEEMKIKTKNGFIKFALGENVKQSNWGDQFTIRYPQTRMGVEQVFYDSFFRAKNYIKEWDAYRSLSKKERASTAMPRKDLELEILAEILKSERFITCHSYAQSEINMLMHVADSMGFKVDIFTHILEGYKVADKMREHGVGASTFSDWWAYKFEVNDAIPYNGAILNEMGVITAYNSDDAEMARRLNQEAAKAVKYGGVSEEDALKMITLNPAILLHLDKRMGSIKVGKDADLVLWTDNPLSVYAKVKQTYVDGICLYDSKRDLILREAIKTERARLIQKMINEKNNGGKTQKPVKTGEELYKCGSIHDEL